MILADFLNEAGEQPIYYFAYGMLTDPEIMQGIDLVGVAELPNFRYEMLEYADVVPTPGSVVYGCLWRVDRRIIANLDRVEGYPTLYDRKTVPAYVNGEKYVAELYTMTPATREQLAGTVPRQSYVNKIVRGYNHAGVPLDQVKQALQIAHKNKTKTVDEAAMNPSAFAAAISTGQQKGVLVGFEFEVCIPAKTIKTKMPKVEVPELTAEEVQEALGYALDDLDARSFNFKIFDLLFKANPSAGLKFATVKDASRALRDDSLTKIKAMFNEIPVERRAAFIRSAKQRVADRPDLFRGMDPEMAFAQGLGKHLYYSFNSGKLERLGGQIMSLSNRPYNYRSLVLAMMGTDSWYDAMSRFNQAFSYDPKQVIETLKLRDYLDDEDDIEDEGDGYADGARLMKPYVEQTMGAKVKVFSDYHQDTKNLTDWYIEPDGSLEPKDNDSALEIVSPPLPAATAMDALKKFYAMSKQLNLYTGPNYHTGLHINVSIPNSIDVLKLAVFLGDRYVLEMFDRLDNNYAASVMKSLEQRSNNTEYVTITGSNKELNMRALQQLISSVTRSHYASISDSGKYISFRHSGGDYLNRYDDIVNVVGRFVRAMIIASDANAYRQEYLKKLVAMFGQAAPAKTSSKLNTIKELYNAVKQQGMPVYSIDVMQAGRWGPNILLELIRDNIGYTIGEDTITVNASSQQAKQNIVSKIRSTELKQKAQAKDVRSFFNAVVGSEVIQVVANMLKGNPSAGVNTIRDRDDYDDKIYGYYAITKTYLPPNDPETAKFLKLVATEYIRRAKQEKTNQRRAATRARNRAGQQ